LIQVLPAFAQALFEPLKERTAFHVLIVCERFRRVNGVEEKQAER
jgi:hypothetical protein